MGGLAGKALGLKQRRVVRVQQGVATAIEARKRSQMDRIKQTKRKGVKG